MASAASTPPTPVTAGGGSDPDPSVLTTQQLWREQSAMRELLDARLEGMRAVFDTRLDGMDKAIVLLQNSLDRIPDMRQEMIEALKVLIEEKFSGLTGIMEQRFVGIDTQFKERDTRTEQTRSSDKIAVDAAFAAQKEAIGKTEFNFTKQIDGLIDRTDQSSQSLAGKIEDSNKNLDGKIDDIKTRINGSEGKASGSNETIRWIFASAGFLVALIAIGGYLSK